MTKPLDNTLIEIDTLIEERGLTPLTFLDAYIRDNVHLPRHFAAVEKSLAEWRDELARDYVVTETATSVTVILKD